MIELVDLVKMVLGELGFNVKLGITSTPSDLYLDAELKMDAFALTRSIRINGSKIIDHYHDIIIETADPNTDVQGCIREWGLASRKSLEKFLSVPGTNPQI